MRRVQAQREGNQGLIWSIHGKGVGIPVVLRRHFQTANRNLRRNLIAFLQPDSAQDQHRHALRVVTLFGFLDSGTRRHPSWCSASVACAHSFGE